MCQYVSFYIIAYSRLLLLIISGLVKTVVLLFTDLTYCVEPGLTKVDAFKNYAVQDTEKSTHIVAAITAQNSPWPLRLDLF